ncbi:MAG: hypothetical protein PHY08_08485 [Candidatus Cloacimonetes bacterium]|nr:hypothetical protein [Candidatus Cloacimonadota bacterium]
MIQIFIYCFDEQEKQKLQSQLKLYKESNIDTKQCWIFIIDSNNKFNFGSIDKSKCIITNKMTF